MSFGTGNAITSHREFRQVMRIRSGATSRPKVSIGKETAMSTKALFTCAALAVSCVVSTGSAQAQSPLNSFTWFAPAPAYAQGPAYGPTPYCPNGNCGTARSSYYAPAYSSRPNGNYGVTGLCANGRCPPTSCANGQCAPNGYPNGNYGTVPSSGYYAPVNPGYPTQPSYYRTPPVPSYTAPNSNWSTSNYRPTYDPWTANYGQRTNRMYNSGNSPFYP
jgi:hypothetical protein